jgi:hypothetical protein
VQSLWPTFHWLVMVASAGTIPADIGNSRFLRYLYLMNNNLTGMLPAISCAAVNRL